MTTGKADEAAQGKQQLKSDKRKPKDDDRKRDDQADKPLTEDQRLDKEEMEKKQREEYEARAEERRLKTEEDRRKAEEERQRAEQMRKQREAKLKGAFAVGDDEEDDEQDREAQLVRRASERKREMTDSNARGLQAAAEMPTTLAVMQGPRTAPVDPDLSAKLRFEPGLDPAEAFMRLQERKRKGRRAEFGGPPRGCSPWRDGKRGVTWGRQDEEER